LTYLRHACVNLHTILKRKGC